MDGDDDVNLFCGGIRGDGMGARDGGADAFKDKNSKLRLANLQHQGMTDIDVDADHVELYGCGGVGGGGVEDLDDGTHLQ